MSLCYKASTLLNSTIENPNPSKGPNLLYLKGSSELPHAAIVLPQKFPVGKRTSAFLSYTFLTLYPHLRANFIAVYPDSTPPFMKIDLS